MADRVRPAAPPTGDAEPIGLVGSWGLDLRDRSVNWSNGIVDLYGLDRAGFDVDYTPAINCIHPDDQGDTDAAIDD